jgi:hypothetical protein
LKGSAPFEAAQLDWSEARVTNQAQLEVRHCNIDFEENDQRVIVSMSAP